MKKNKVLGDFKTTSFETQELKVNQLNTNIITNPLNSITMRGYLKMTGIKTSQPLSATSLIAKGKMFHEL